MHRIKEKAYNLYAIFTGIDEESRQKIYQHLVDRVTPNSHRELVLRTLVYMFTFFDVHDQEPNLNYVTVTQLTNIYQSNLLMQGLSTPKGKPKLVDFVPNGDVPDIRLRRLYEIHNPIRLNFLYLAIQMLIHSIQWTPQEYRVISIIFYPYDVKFKMKNEPQTEYRDWFPFYTPPFMLALQYLTFGRQTADSEVNFGSTRPFDAGWLRARDMSNTIPTADRSINI